MSLTEQSIPRKTYPKEIQRIVGDPLVLAWCLGYKKLTHPIHREWIKELWRPGDSTLMAHRNSYKTTTRVVGLIWGLLMYPETRILLVRKTQSEANSTLFEIMQHYDRDLMRQLYREIHEVDSPADYKNWSRNSMSLSAKKEVTKEGNIETTGIGKYKTGSHYDLIVADDIVTAEDRYSHAEREGTKQYIKELHNILNAGGIGIKYSGTPWHDDDAYTITPEPKKYPVSLGFVSEMTKERLEYIREEMKDESLFQANYHLRHVATEDRVFVNPKFAPVPEDFQPYGFLDPAFGDKKTNDFSALSIAGVQGEKILVSGGYIWRSTLDKSYQTIVDLCHRHNVSVLFVESNQAQVAVAMELGNRGLTVRTINALKNKHQRIMHYCGKMWESIIFSHDLDNSPYLKQILDYVDPQVSAHDDAPDSLAGVIQCLTGTPRKVELGYFEL